MDDKKNNLETCKQKYNQPHMSERQIEEMKKKIEQAKQRNKFNKVYKTVACVAAVLAMFIVLPNTSAGVAHAMENIPLLGRLVNVVTFRDYQYESERHHADIEVPELVPAKDENSVTEETPESMAEEAKGQEPKETQEQTVEDTQEQTTQEKDEVHQKLEKSTEQINAEIQAISEQFISEFEEGLQYEEGYQDVMVKSEVMNTTQDYFTLKLICYMGSGSGAEWNYYYTLDLNTGERLQLKDLFQEGADYITPISENIKVQMREQMAADDMNHYWLDDEIDEWNFKQITDETAFYINENGNIVISFNEGDVAPMYMGVVTFEIPDEVVKDIRTK